MVVGAEDDKVKAIDNGGSNWNDVRWIRFVFILGKSGKIDQNLRNMDLSLRGPWIGKSQLKDFQRKQKSRDSREDTDQCLVDFSPRRMILQEDR